MIPSSAIARVAALAFVLAVSEGVFALAAARRAPVTVDVGPSTGASSFETGPPRRTL